MLYIIGLILSTLFLIIGISMLRVKWCDDNLDMKLGGATFTIFGLILFGIVIMSLLS